MQVPQEAREAGPVRHAGSESAVPLGAVVEGARVASLLEDAVRSARILSDATPDDFYITDPEAGGPACLIPSDDWFREVTWVLCGEAGAGELPVFYPGE
jgi:hypothetical protein